MAQRRKSLRELNASIDRINAIGRRIGEPPIPKIESYAMKIRRLALALPREKRQEFMDLVNEGGITLEQVRIQLGLSMDEALGILRLNTVRTTIVSFRKVSK